MRLGLYYDLRNPGGARSWARVYAAALDRIGWADRAGIGAIWVTEHHGFADGYLPAPLTFCAAIATRTSRARIGTAVVVSPLIPRPLPVWVGARGPRGARLAGRTGAGLLWIDRDLFEPYLAGLAQADPPALPRVGGLANVFLADDPDRVLAAVREHGRRNRASYEDAGAAGRETAFPKLRILTPAAAAAWISELCAGLPVTDVFCFGDIGGLDDDLVERHTELAVRELAPRQAEEGEL